MDFLISIPATIHWAIKSVIYSGVYSDTYEDIGDGGPTCYKEMTVEFRLIISLVMAPFQYVVQRYFVKKIEKKYPGTAEDQKGIEPSLLEKVFGIISICLFALQICYKFPVGKGIFLFNPCHVVLLLEAYILLSTKNSTAEVLYANFTSLLFSPWCGIFFAINVGLNGPLEVEMYWVEHFWSALINPLVLVLSGRYRDRKYFDVYYRLVGFAFFSLYHRVILFPLSIATWANLDQTLCHAETDPFYGVFGKYYYLMADFYLPIASNLFAYIYLIVAEIIYYLKDVVETKKIKED